MENTVIPRKIGSVSSYIKAIFDLRNTKVSEYSLSSYWFFRGQKNSLWGMCPNVFRNDALKYEFDAILGHTNASFTLDTYTHVTSDMQKQACGIVGGFMEDIFGKELKPWQESEKPETEQ